MPRLSAPMLNIGSLKEFPILMGPSIKAASTRALLPWAEEIAILQSDGTEYRENRRKMISYLLLFQRTVLHAGPFLTDDERAAAQKGIRRHLKYYHWLSLQVFICAN